MLSLWQWFAAVTVNQQGFQEVDEWEGGSVHTTAAAAAVTQVLGPLGLVPGRGGGSDGGGSDDDSCPLGSPSSSRTRETVRRRAPPVKAQLWPELSPVMGGWKDRPLWPLGGTVQGVWSHFCPWGDRIGKPLPPSGGGSRGQESRDYGEASLLLAATGKGEF